VNKTLDDFIAHARNKGMDYPTIRLLLLSAGWREKDIAQAMTAEGLEVQIPVPPDRGGARDAFLHLVTFAALYTTVISLVFLFFSYISYHFPDPAIEWTDNRQEWFLSNIRWSMAAVIVTYPLFFALTYYLLREMRDHPEKAASGIRRGLTYLTLFIAAMDAMGDVITLVFNLLEGELSARFLLKILVVFVFSSLTFTYYFLAMRSKPNER
jgi:hypothetical protein